MSHYLSECRVELFHLGQVSRNVGQGVSSPMPNVTGELGRPVVVVSQQVVLVNWVGPDQGVLLDVDQERIQSVGTKYNASYVNCEMGIIGDNETG